MSKKKKRELFLIQNFVKLFSYLLIIILTIHFIFEETLKLTTIISRTLVLTIILLIIEEVYWKTKDILPYKHLIVAFLFSLILITFSNYSQSFLSYTGVILGIENLDAKAKYLLESQLGFISFKELKPRLYPPEILARYKTANETLQEKVLEFRNQQYVLELKIHKLVNKVRKEYGLQTLEWDEKLAEIARYHSKDMALKNYFAHESPEGETLQDRYKKFNYSCRVVVGNLIYRGGENLLQTHIYTSYYYNPKTGEITSYVFQTIDEVANATVQGWLGSEGHRKNLLAEYYRREGIGVYITNNGTVYVTQNFC